MRSDPHPSGHLLSRRLVPLAVFLVLLVIAMAVPGAAAQPHGSTAPAVKATLMRSARDAGAVRVIVELDHAVDVSRLRWAPARQRLTAAIARDARILGRVARATGGRMLWWSRHIPSVVLDATPSTLRALARSPLVRSVTPDRLMRPFVNFDPWPEKLGIVDMIADGHVGARQVVAIVDSGVRSSHARLSGRLVGEACFASGFSPILALGDCPNGAKQAVGAGSAVPCDWNDCAHGTEVAGVAVGMTTTQDLPDGSTQTTTGVAPAASYIAIRAASKKTDPGSCGSEPAPCLRFRTSDVVRALDHLVDRQVNGPGDPTSVNLSLGDGRYLGTCDARTPSMTQAMALLSANGVAVVAASGNEGKEGLAFPACVSHAISVGGATNFNQGKYNWATLLDLAAPSSDVYTTTVSRSMGYLTGTSAVAPFVAGAFAALRSRFPHASVSRMLTALQTTGLLISHPGLSHLPRKPRIRIHRAAEWMGKTRTTAGVSSALVTSGSSVTLTVRVRSKRSVGSKPAGTVRLQRVGGRGSWTIALDATGRAQKTLTISGSPRTTVRYRFTYPGDVRFEGSRSPELQIFIIR